MIGPRCGETTVAGGEEVDAALVVKIRVQEEKPAEVDPFEATRIIEQLSQAEVDDVVAAGASFRVSARVLGGVTTHQLIMPSARDVIEYRRGFLRSVDLPYGKQEITVNLGAASALYTKLCEASEGFAVGARSPPRAGRFSNPQPREATVQRVGIGGNRDQVDVIRHQAVAREGHTVQTAVLTEEAQIGGAVAVPFEHPLPALPRGQGGEERRERAKRAINK